MVDLCADLRFFGSSVDLIVQTVSLLKAAHSQQQPLSRGAWTLYGALSAGPIPGQKGQESRICITSLAGLALWHGDSMARHWALALSLAGDLQK